MRTLLGKGKPPIFLLQEKILKNSTSGADNQESSLLLDGGTDSAQTLDKGLS